MTQPLVSIITVNYNETAVTLELLRSIERNSYRNVEVIVVDNASRETPRPAIEREFPGVRVLESAENLGFAGGNNLGVDVARGAYLFFINNDAELTDGCLEGLLGIFEQHPNAGIASPQLHYFPGQTTNKHDESDGGHHPNTAANKHDPQRSTTTLIQYSGATPVYPLTARNRTLGHQEPDCGQFGVTPTPTAYAHGAAMLVPRRVLDAVGPMLEDYFLYYEELDWCERIRRAGYSVWVHPGVRVYHKESLATGKISALKMYYLTRNRILFLRRNFGAGARAAFFTFFALVTTPKHLLTLMLRRDWTNLRAFGRAIAWHFRHPLPPRFPAVRRRAASGSADPAPSVPNPLA